MYGTKHKGGMHSIHPRKVSKRGGGKKGMQHRHVKHRSKLRTPMR